MAGRCFEHGLRRPALLDQALQVARLAGRERRVARRLDDVARKAREAHAGSAFSQGEILSQADRPNDSSTLD